jgi:hypothetical protein
VHPGPDGKLVYRTDAQGNRIPDFSQVGYRGGGVAPPTVPARAEVSPAPGDAGSRIQAALDAVAQLPPDKDGIRGAVLLKKGRYPIAGSLYLRAGGVVLRGEVSGADGTVLVATGVGQRSLIVVGGRDARALGDEELNDSRTATLKVAPRSVTDDYVPVGARQLHLNRADGLKIGDEIIIRRPSTAAWIHDLGMDRIPTAPGRKVVQWKPGSKDLWFNRAIVAVEGDAITIDAPIVCALEKRYGGAQVMPAGPDGALREIGIEDLRGESEFRGPEDEDHGWVLVDLVGVRDAWVRRVTAVHFGYSCVYVRRQSRAVTIDGCACLDPVSQITGGRRYSFALDGQLTLVQHCYARNGRHDFVMHALAAGPNVFHDCLAEEAHADSGPHHRWSVGVLYDNVRVFASRGGARAKGVGLNLRNRGNLGTGHGWAGANQVAWNCEAGEMIIEQPPTAQNWAIGCVTPAPSGNAYWESAGNPVAPRSLFEAQLEERLAARQPEPAKDQ